MRTPKQRRQAKIGKCSRCTKKYDPKAKNDQLDPKWFRVEDALVCKSCAVKHGLAGA